MMIPKLTDAFRITEEEQKTRDFVFVKNFKGKKIRINVMNSIKEFKKNLERIGFPFDTASKGNCHAVSRWFIVFLGLVPKNIEPHDSKLDAFTKKRSSPLHHWVNLDGLNIDWTARQFDSGADVPLVWEDPLPHPVLGNDDTDDEGP